MKYTFEKGLWPDLFCQDDFEFPSDDTATEFGISNGYNHVWKVEEGRNPDTVYSMPQHPNILEFRRNKVLDEVKQYVRFKAQYHTWDKLDAEHFIGSLNEGFKAFHSLLKIQKIRLIGILKMKGNGLILDLNLL